MKTTPNTVTILQEEDKNLRLTSKKSLNGLPVEHDLNLPEELDAKYILPNKIFYENHQENSNSKDEQLPKCLSSEKAAVDLSNSIQKESGISEALPSIVDVLKKKRDKQEWSRKDIRCFVQGATYARITDAQIGAGLMAICLNGMTDRETSDLTQEMIDTGVRLPRPSHWAPGSVVGKHSTGGVGDKVTVALVPALAACGLKVPKLSGRGLGHTGGTLDKLESIPGFRVYYSSDEVVDLVDRVGCCIVGVNDKLNPADKILYAIRDTTGTTESLPLVAGSVMCKKAAESLDSLALEVTYGQAALIKTREEAIRLSRLMIETGRSLNISTAAVLVRMDGVLGRAVGNSLEIEEAVDCMHGLGPTDVIEVCCRLGSYLLVQAGVVKTQEEGSDMIKLRLQDGSAAIKFYEMMKAQGVQETVARKVARLDRLSNGYHGNCNSNIEKYCQDENNNVQYESKTKSEISGSNGACFNGQTLSQENGLKPLRKVNNSCNSCAKNSQETSNGNYNGNNDDIDQTTTNKSYSIGNGKSEHINGNEVTHENGKAQHHAVENSSSGKNPNNPQNGPRNCEAAEAAIEELELLEGSSSLPRAAKVTKLFSKEAGYVKSTEAYRCGHVVRNLGAGRSKPGDVIDYSAGLKLLVSPGMEIKSGDAWVEVHHNRALTTEMISELESALCIVQQPVTVPSAVDAFLD